ncbi:MAG: glycosyltransferase [Acidobacteria bacterium]|nr:glycosyltransferase [Acidobacteriota bacterium]
MSGNSPFITVIVPVYNGHDYLHQCLDAIFASSYGSFEMIVVDDCSTDDSAEIGRSKGSRILSTAKQSGPAAARNLAAETAEGEILMFVDADVVVKPETIGKVAERFERQPEISALFGSYDDEPAEKNFLSQYKNLQHHFVHQNSSSKASTFWSGLGAVRREVFVEQGGFDCRKFSVPSIEDIDLGFRMSKAGRQIILDRSIQAKHLKKWKIIPHLRTEIFLRALPWSRLIHENQGMINDMNLKTADRASAVLVGLLLVTFPVVFWQPAASFLIVLFLLVIAFLNRRILRFFAEKRGIVFAAMAFPWQLLYFFYSAVTFVVAWLMYALPKTLGFGRKEAAGSHGNQF